MRILVVEDNKDIHDNLVEFLELKGHEVEGALDGLSGLHLAASKSFDAIILDVMLPGVDGNQICLSLREHSKSDVSIIMLSARDQLRGRRTAAEELMGKYPSYFRDILRRVLA